MHHLLLLVASLVVLGSAQASEVFVTKDAQGRPIYTDRPESLPAQKVNVATKQTDTVEVQRQYDEKMKSYSDADKARAEAAKKAVDSQQAQELSAADKAKRCQESRTRYQNMMNARRLYEPGSTGEDRRYLDSNEIDAARENAKKVMDEFCAGQ
jgi:thiol:disulfide interchange protein